MYGRSLFWRETHRPARFLVFDARITTVLLLTAMHLRLWTVFLSLFLMCVLYWFEHRGVMCDSIPRYLKCLLLGSRRTAAGFQEERLPVDFGFEARMPWLLAVDGGLGKSDQAGAGCPAPGPGLGKDAHAGAGLSASSAGMDREPREAGISAPNGALRQNAAEASARRRASGSEPRPC